MFDTNFNVAAGHVKVRTDSKDVIDYLRRFYSESENEQGNPLWTFTAYQRESIQWDNAPSLTKYGVKHSTDIENRRTCFQQEDALHLKITTRHAIREIFMHSCESHKFTMLHGSAVSNGEHLILFLGNNCAGKTTLALDAVFNSGYRLISNDYLIAYKHGDNIVFTTLPAFISIKIGTYFHFESKLPKPDPTNEADPSQFRNLSEDELRGLDVPIYYSFADLGQTPIPSHIIPINDSSKKVFIVTAGFSKETKAPSEILKADNPFEELFPHIRSKWIYGPYNYRFLDLPRRSEAEFMQESIVFAKDMLATKHFVTLKYMHHGSIKALIPHLSTLA